MTIIECMEDEKLFKPFFSDPSWNAWKAILKGIFCLDMDAEETNLFRGLAGGREPPRELVPETYILAGRRSGKSRIASLLATWRATFFDYRAYAAPGETILCGVTSHTRDNANVILNYIKAFLEVPILEAEVDDTLTSRIRLANGVLIATETAKQTTGRGYSIPFFILEESSFYKSEGIGRDEEILNAIYPGLGTIPDSMILSISTPYASSGINYDAWAEAYGKNDADRLVIVAPTTVLNPTINRRIIDRQSRRDPVAASSEWILDVDQPFRQDISNFIDMETVESCVERGVTRRAPVDGFDYVGFFDASGGRNDASAFCIGHRDAARLILDVLVSRGGRHDPRDFIKEACGLCGMYGLARVQGDKYAAEFVSQAFRDEGITYQNSELNRSQIYSEALPFLTTGQAVLLDDSVLKKELSTLERRTGASGKDIIDHSRGGSDDRSNVACGVLALIGKKQTGLREIVWLDWGLGQRQGPVNPFRM